MRKTQKTTAVVGGTIAAVLVGGVAFAYWTTSGSGSGTGSTTAGTANLVISQTTDLAPMFPGDDSQNLTVNVMNNADNSAYVATVKAYITTDKVGCTGDDFLLGGTAGHSDAASAQTLSWTATDLAAGGDANATSTIQFNNKSGVDENQDACKDAAVTLHYAAS